MCDIVQPMAGTAQEIQRIALGTFKSFLSLNIDVVPIPVSSLVFDPSEELLWTGNSMVTQFLSYFLQ